MNERDSEIMAQLLAANNYAATKDMNAADIIIVNTCSVREKAEQKAYSLLGRLKVLKRANPSLVIAVSGCVAQQNGASLLKRMPFIDLILGPQNIYRLPELLATVERPPLLTKFRRHKTTTDLSPAFEIPPFLPIITNNDTIKRFVTIMQGCNNFCTYCIVPFTRGREISRKSDEILSEIRHLVKHGVKEVTLLGQNVNSYGIDKKNDVIKSFPDLLRAVNAIDGLQRIRFTTSHPKDLSEELINCFAELEKLCSHIHLPVQSGSNKILKAMNRKYSIETYLEKVARLRQVKPDITLTTDIIVGFPGETDTDFDETMHLLEKIRFYGGYSFKYSDRPNTPSAKLLDKVDETIKEVRLSKLQTRQNEITLDCCQSFVGKVFEVMVEGKSKNNEGQWSGRTSGNIVVNFKTSSQMHLGQTVMIIIRETGRNSLKGELVH